MGGSFNLSQNGWGIAGEGEERITTFGGGQRTPMNSDKSRAGCPPYQAKALRTERGSKRSGFREKAAIRKIK